MKISSIGNRVRQILNPSQEQKISKYVKIDTDLGKDVLDQLYPARPALVKYAKDKGVKIRIYDAQKDHYKNMALETADEFVKFKDKIGILVSSKKKKGSAFWSLMSKDIKATYNQVGPRYFVVDIPTDGTQKVVFSEKYEDNFLRHIYREISEMANQITKKR